MCRWLLAVEGCRGRGTLAAGWRGYQRMAVPLPAGVVPCGWGFRVGALAGGDAVEKPVESPEVLLGGDVAGHGGCRCDDSGELAGWGAGEGLVPGGYLFRRG